MPLLTFAHGLFEQCDPEWLEQVIDSGETECGHGILVVGGNENNFKINCGQ